jgi:hypothetical protein
MKRILVFILFTSATLLFCEETNVNPDAYIQIDSTKLYLRYSNRSDVEKFFGKPENVKYYEHGGEGFLWKNFVVCSYNNSKLSFNYADDGRIIRITVYSSFGRSESVKLKYGQLITLVKSDVKERVNGKEIFYESDTHLLYSENVSFSTIAYTYRFDEHEKIIWYDMYYEKPWD